MNTLREEYEAWFKRTYNKKPMPIHSIAHDFCWEGYRVGAASRDTDNALMWYNDLSQAIKERDHYHSLLLQCAMHLGPEVCSEDGVFTSDPVLSKIPGLIANMVSKQEENQKTIGKLVTKLIRS